MCPNLTLALLLFFGKYQAETYYIWAICSHATCRAWTINSWRLGKARQTDVWVEVVVLSSQWRIKVLIKSRLEREVVEESQTNTYRKHTFYSREVNAGVLMNPNAVANDPKRAFLECTRACHQLKKALKKRHEQMDWLHPHFIWLICSLSCYFFANFLFVIMVLFVWNIINICRCTCHPK